jgi:hypothetical protein
LFSPDYIYTSSAIYALIYARLSLTRYVLLAFAQVAEVVAAHVMGLILLLLQSMSSCDKADHATAKPMAVDRRPLVEGGIELGRGSFGVVIEGTMGDGSGKKVSGTCLRAYMHAQQLLGLRFTHMHACMHI